MPARTLSRQAATMGWDRPHRGTYSLPGTQRTLERDAAAALLAVGDKALLTGNTALYLYQVLNSQPALVEVVVPADARPGPRKGVRLLRTRAYEDIRPRTISNLRLVHPTRALADGARSAEAVPLARLIARAVALRHCTLAHAREELEARQRFAGRTAYRQAVLMLEGELTHSSAERFGRRELQAVGLEPFPRPYPIVVGGVLLAEADIAFVPISYDLEIDGPHHDLPEQVKADKARDRRLGRHGWTVDRYPVEFVLRQPKTFVREVLARVRQLEQRLR